jgi:hypothetical protein
LAYDVSTLILFYWGADRRKCRTEYSNVSLPYNNRHRALASIFQVATKPRRSKQYLFKMLILLNLKNINMPFKNKFNKLNYFKTEITISTQLYMQCGSSRKHRSSVMLIVHKNMHRIK